MEFHWQSKLSAVTGEITEYGVIYRIYCIIEYLISIVFSAFIMAVYYKY